MKRFAVIMLTVIMLLVTVLAPMTVSARIFTDGKCGDNATWKFNTKNGFLMIYGSGDMKINYGTETEQWNSLKKDVKAVFVSKGITSVGYFENFQSLEKVILPDSVTTIMDSAFKYCRNLATINLPDSVKSIMDHAFEGCKSLESITLPNKIREIGSYAFYNCSSLASILIPVSVRYVGVNVFVGCDSMTDIYCEYKSYPPSWDEFWNGAYDAKVHWGYDPENPSEPTPAPWPNPMRGDVNDDGKITSLDYMIIKFYFNGRYKILAGLALLAADYNSDGKINSTDYLALKHFFAGK